MGTAIQNRPPQTVRQRAQVTTKTGGEKNDTSTRTQTEIKTPTSAAGSAASGQINPGGSSGRSDSRIISPSGQAGSSSQGGSAFIPFPGIAGLGLNLRGVNSDSSAGGRRSSVDGMSLGFGIPGRDFAGYANSRIRTQDGSGQSVETPIGGTYGPQQPGFSGTLTQPGASGSLTYGPNGLTASTAAADGQLSTAGHAGVGPNGIQANTAAADGQHATSGATRINNTGIDTAASTANPTSAISARGQSDRDGRHGHHHIRSESRQPQTPGFPQAPGWRRPRTPGAERFQPPHLPHHPHHPPRPGSDRFPFRPPFPTPRQGPSDRYPGGRPRFRPQPGPGQLPGGGPLQPHRPQPHQPGHGHTQHNPFAYSGPNGAWASNGNGGGAYAGPDGAWAQTPGQPNPHHPQPEGQVPPQLSMLDQLGYDFNRLAGGPNGFLNRDQIGLALHGVEGSDKFLNNLEHFMFANPTDPGRDAWQGLSLNDMNALARDIEANPKMSWDDLGKMYQNRTMKERQMKSEADYWRDIALYRGH